MTKTKRSKFVTFTYIWQVLTAVLVLACVVLAILAFVAGAFQWVIYLLDAMTFGVLFFTAFLWRANHDSLQTYGGIR